MADRDAKGRQRCGFGENHGLAKLTAEQVLEIRSMRGVKQVHIAKLYGIDQSHVSNIINGKNWVRL